jgi:hypothetical protein
MKFIITLILLTICLSLVTSSKFTIDCNALCSKFVDPLKNRACRIGCEWPKKIFWDDADIESDMNEAEGDAPIYPESDAYNIVALCKQCKTNCAQRGLTVSSRSWRSCIRYESKKHGIVC